MTDLTEFLVARIDEDEAIARAASEGRTWTWSGDDLESEHTYAIGTMTGRECIIATEGANPPDPDGAGVHIARHDPARVLAECKAKRVAVDWYLNDDDTVMSATIKALAAVYADHPDYDPSWS